MGLKGYVIKRALLAIITLYIVITLNFFIFRVLSPMKDPSSLIIDPGSMRAEQIEILRNLWGLNRPLFPDQYLLYLWNLFTWNYGLSFGQPPTPIAPEMSWRLVNTLMVLGAAVIGTILVGIPLGLLAGSRRGSKTDVSVIGIGLFTWGVPTFFVQILFILLFSYGWNRWFGFPLIAPFGVISLPPPQDPLKYTLDVAWHAAGPIITLVIAGFGSWALYTRNMIVDALTEDFIVTAQAKGVKARDILYKHAFRSILPPIATIIAMAIPGVVTGAIITEQIFSWPGIGAWYIEALNIGNHPVAQAVLYNYAVLMIIANLFADLLYGTLDPRIRVGMRR